MNKKLFMGLLLVGALFTGCGGAKKNQVIQVKGSDTIVNASQAITEGFMKENKDAKIAVTGGGSGVGISALINKTTDIAMASRNIKEKELKKANEVGVNIEEIVLGYDGITLIVNHDNNVKELSSETLGKIFRGEVTNWKEIGGDDATIVALSRDNSSGTHEFFKEHIVRGNGDDAAEYGEKTLYMPSNEAIKQEVKNNKYAVGYIGMGYMDSSVHGMAVDNVLPTAANVSDKSYPIARAVYWYVPAKREGDIKALVDYAISPAGQEFVEAEGFVKR